MCQLPGVAVVALVIVAGVTALSLRSVSLFVVDSPSETTGLDAAPRVLLHPPYTLPDRIPVTDPPAS